MPSCFRVTAVQSKSIAGKSTRLMSSCNILFLVDRGISCLNKGKGEGMKGKENSLCDWAFSIEYQKVN